MPVERMLRSPEKPRDKPASVMGAAVEAAPSPARGVRSAEPSLRWSAACHDARILIACALAGLPVVLPGVLREGLASTAALYLGAATIIVATVLATSRQAPPCPLRVAELPGWMLRRGILYGLLEAPIFAVLVGYFFGYVSYPVAAFPVLVSAALLPIWVVWRQQVALDPEEPVHNLPRYARAAIVPVAVFSLVRIPTFYLFGIAYWHPWYSFGNALTGAPLDEYGALVAGATLYALQGFALVMGYYVLFRGHTLLSAVLYLCVWDSGLYSYAFPLTRLGMETTPLWHANGIFAHFCLAVSVWGMPRFWSTVWPRMTGGLRWTTRIVVACAVVIPFAFAAYQATVWQFPLQHRIDQATFGRDGLMSLEGAPQVAVDGQEAHYVYSMQFGPRLYRNWAGATRALEADHMRLSGRVTQGEATIAWCSKEVVRFGGPPPTRDPVAYRSALEDRTWIPVTCVGPATSLDRQRQFAMEWEVHTDLVGDREQVPGHFWGTQLTGATSQ